MMKKNGGVLERILREAHEAAKLGQRFLAVFDLDSTLFDLTQRVQDIVDAFMRDPAVRARFPVAYESAAKIKIGSRDWGIREALERAGLFEKDHTAFYRELHDHWAFCFFSNRYLHVDTPLPGAVEFVLELERLGAHIHYLTGRDVGRMWDGTRDSLRAWRFPLDAEHTKLILKPDPCLDDATFKLEVLRQEKATYDRVWLFENEPVNLHLVQQNLPDVGLVMIDTTHSRREQPSPLLERIPHFEVDLEAFRKFAGR